MNNFRKATAIEMANMPDWLNRVEFQMNRWGLIRFRGELSRFTLSKDNIQTISDPGVSLRGMVERYRGGFIITTDEVLSGMVIQRAESVVEAKRLLIKVREANAQVFAKKSAGRVVFKNNHNLKPPFYDALFPIKDVVYHLLLNDGEILPEEVVAPPVVPLQGNALDGVD